MSGGESQASKPTPEAAAPTLSVVPRRFMLPLVAAAVTSSLAATKTGEAVRGHRYCVSSIPGKFDSDRRQDTALVYSTRLPCYEVRSRPWYVVVRLGSGRILRRQIGHDQSTFGNESDTGCEVTCAVRAAPDFNRDGRHEIEVSIQQGATQEQRGIYGVVRGRLRRLPGRPFGNRFSFSYGGGGLYGAFVVCRRHRGQHRVVAVTWGRLDHTHFGVGEDVYAFNGLRFRPISTTTRRVSGRRFPPRVAGRPC
jgi:hypothetical protein